MNHRTLKYIKSIMIAYYHLGPFHVQLLASKFLASMAKDFIQV